MDDSRVEVVPVAIFPPDRLSAERLKLIDGVTIRKNSGRIAAEMRAEVEHFRASIKLYTPVIATHLLIVEETRYIEGLAARLKRENFSIGAQHVMAGDIARQAVISLTLLGRLHWQYGMLHHFRRLPSGELKRAYGMTNLPIVQVSTLLQLSMAYTVVEPHQLRAVFVELDRYYRADHWWSDQISVALGYLFSALTTTSGELAFAALCMALEAMAHSPKTEIMHTLAVRCSWIIGKDAAEREAVYRNVRRLYDLRSKIVHGRTQPKKGPIHGDTMLVTAKRSAVPRRDLSLLLDITCRVVLGVLKDRQLRTIYQTKQSEDNTQSQLDSHFLRLILR